jgi:hypothetical protein
MEQTSLSSSELMNLGTKVPAVPSNASPQTTSDFVGEGHQHQNQPARDHVKWPEFVAYCESQKGKRGKDRRHVHDGIPTENGFWKWLLGQAPQWRNKRKEPGVVDVYVLDGNIFTPDEANRIAAENPALIERFQKKKARKGTDGKFVVISEPKR